MNINVCASANSKYMRYLYIMLFSLMESNKQHCLNIYILQRDFSFDDRRALLKLAEDYEQNITFVDIDEKTYVNFPDTQRFSLEAFFRLEIIDRMPSTMDRIIYFDVDMIIRGDIGELYTTPLDGYYFGACLDMVAYELMPKHRELFNRYDDLRYFNSGMMIWNLQELRGKVSFDDFYSAAEELNFDLPLVDQDILNYKYYNKTKYLESVKYNFLVTKFLRDGWNAEDAKDAIVLHYTSISPWAVGTKSPIYEIWWNYAKKTPYYVELLEEQLKRVEEETFKTEVLGAGSKPNRSIVINCLDKMVRCKGNGLVKKLFLDNRKYVLYGAGRLASRLMDVLSFEGLLGRIEGIIDKKKEKDFYGIPVYHDYLWMDKNSQYTIIVTPSYDIDKILLEINNISKNNNMTVKTITITDWLNELDK